MFMPKAVKTSAEPDLLETPLLPCFATGIPEPAVTNAATVEIFVLLALFLRLFPSLPWRRL